jgi:sugar phosphate isomerase/epimerase
MVFAEGHDSDASAPLSLATDAFAGRMARFCARLDRIARHLRSAGVRLAFHHHMGTVCRPRTRSTG